MSVGELTKDFTKSIRDVRMKFLEHVDPWRPDLFRYCRALTGSVWDAEDLVQETLLKAFARLGEVHWDVAKPRSWLLAVATNAWRDRQRREEPSALPDAWDEAAKEEPPRAEVREALLELARALPPQERACVLPKDVFDFSLDETARALGTSAGAVKAALHRGRARLGERPQETLGERRVSDRILDEFVAAFDARDLDRLIALFREDATAHVVGMVWEEGPEQIRKGSLGHTATVEPGDARAERRVYKGEPVVVLWYEEDGRRSVGDVLRFVERDGRIESLAYFYFCPEVLEAVGRELGVPVKTNGYRYG